MFKRWMTAGLIGIVAAGGLAYAAKWPIRAASWPTRPVTMVVPFAAGGPTDVVGRIVAQRLGERHPRIVHHLRL